MNEQQKHLKQLIDQRTEIDNIIAKNKELFWKIQGAIEYLTGIGVSLTESENIRQENENEEQ